LVVGTTFDERELLIEDAPETYYVKNYYRGYPLAARGESRSESGALTEHCLEEALHPA
jgi:hypothetical protein